MNELRIRSYNVRFGDAFLISLPDRSAAGENILRHIVIDIGNSASHEGGRDEVFPPVIDDIRRQLGGRPADLYIMTHEHLDHVQGPLYCAGRGQPLAADYVWLTASADPDYYERNTEARKRMQLRDRAYDETVGQLRSMEGLNAQSLQELLEINNPRKTSECVQHIRQLSARRAYVYRDCDLRGIHPFQEAVFDIWGPEENTTIYYSRISSLTPGDEEGGGQGEGVSPSPEKPVNILPPSGVDTGAFYNLVAMRKRGIYENLLAIDKANNNTSVVFTLAWRGWKLLFSGDAEHKSWKLMNKNNKIEPVHFFKVSHHGSATGLPEDAILEKLLPEEPFDTKKRYALVSTYPGTYNNVPAEKLLVEQLARRCSVESTDRAGLADGGSIDFIFTGDSERCVVRKSTQAG
jgi:beta-lactamase superfamily II metal-dependent hydrolase